MNLQQLKILVLIAEHHKVTAVAEALNIKQPTIVFHMKKLEEFAGVPLFDSRHKRVFLTDAGQALFHYASRIVSWAEEAEQMLADYRHFNKGKIIVGASSTPATYFLPGLLGEMQQAYPHVQINLLVKNSPQIVEMIKRFEIDFGLAAEHEINDPDLVVIPLQEDELGLVLFPDHPLADAEFISTDLLRQERWILRENDSASRRMSEEWALQNQLEFKVGMELGSTEAIKRGVMSKLGISMLSLIAVTDEVSSGRLVFKRIPSSALTRNIFLVYNRSRFVTPIIRDFIRFFEAKGN